MTWENMNMFSDVLPTDDEDDEDDIESSIQCLKVRSYPPCIAVNS